MGLGLEKALSIARLTRHQYYYRPKAGCNKRGRPKTTHTPRLVDGRTESRPNAEVVELIRYNHRDPDLSYGYQRMTDHLNLLGYIINKKKTYRIMEEELLLVPKKASSPRKRAEGRRMDAVMPLQKLQMDIKMAWVEQHRSNALILTVLDTFTRRTLCRHTAMSITAESVARVWEKVITEHLQPADLLKRKIKVQLRTDNDPRFAAKAVGDYLKANHVDHEFTRPYTPQENGHVESFHAILGRTLDRYRFHDMEQLEAVLLAFYDKYNNVRIHGSLAGLTPMGFQQAWEAGLVRITKNQYARQVLKLKIPLYQLSGNGNPREASCMPEGQTAKDEGGATRTTIGIKVTVGRILQEQNYNLKTTILNA